jgi:dienelactone hydrolase
MLRYAALALGALFLSQTPAQPRSSSASEPFGLEPGAYSVGFRLLESQDESRPVAGGSGSTTRARPIRTYLWYPAEAAAQPMRFGRYASLADDDIWPAEIAGDLRDKLRFAHGPLARSLEPMELDALLQLPVRAAENAKPLDGPFPLIVIGQGLYYESPISFAALGEYLAGRGFVVATVPLIGDHSPVVRVHIHDLEAQVRDLEFVIAQARRSSFVSPEKLGVLGFDQGGMVGLILAMRNRDVDAFASLDSGILHPHPSGLPRSSPHYDPFALRVPWLHAMGNLNPNQPADSEVESLFDEAVHANRYLLVAGGLAHADFTSYALIDYRREMVGYWPPGSPEAARRHGIVAEYVYNFFAAFLGGNAESLAFLARDPKAAFPDSNMSSERLAATPASIRYDEFVQAVVSGRAEGAIDELRAAAAVEPSHVLLTELYLVRLGTNLLFTWGLAREAALVLEFAVERYPASVTAQGTLAEAYVAVEDYPAAIEIYSRYVEQHPDDAGGRDRLESLRSRSREAR